MDKVVISFIIPALNEESCIGQTIKAIKSNPPKAAYEIIVVDNGSTDKTVEIVRSEKVILVNGLKTTIASARNRGVARSRGSILIFLDADVLLTNAWQNEIDKTVELLLRNPMIVTGSRCNVINNNWLLKYWFARMQCETPKYINSGHLITTKELFKRINGFCAEMQTAEDYDFCMRAKSDGADIINNPKLVVIHTGYPLSVKDFIAREKWHGTQDFYNLKSIAHSKVALIALVNIFSAVALFIMTIITGEIIYIILYFCLMYAVSGISTLIKFGFGSPALLLNTSLIFYFYFLGRSLAFMHRFK